jgi:thiol:disulfide interchange protein DsbD
MLDTWQVGSMQRKHFRWFGLPSRLILGCLLTAGCLASAGRAQGPGGRSPADDPFSEANRLGPRQVIAKKEDPFSQERRITQQQPPVKTEEAAHVPHLTLEAAVEPKRARRGETVKLTITGTVEPGFHTYPVTQRTPGLTDSGLCRIEYQPSPALQPIWQPFTETPPEFEKAQDGSVQLVHKGTFRWSQDLLIKPQATPGPQTLKLNVRGQVCDDQGCVPFHKYPLEVSVEVADGPAVPLTPELEDRLKAQGPAIEVIGGPTDTNGSAPAPEDRSLLGLLLVSMGAAVAMLFTPCVFPMIPITVSFFLKQSEKEHHNALLTAAVYSLTIILVLAAAVLLLGGLIIRLANDSWLNLGLGAILIFFALSLFGMYEIELPAGLARFTSAREAKGSYLGAVFMALTFTITSFTCTGPFLGPLLVAVKEYQLTFTERLLGALAYSATFAAPFFFLALFPRLLKSLPKSGGWLNAVKVVMGFLELAAALKFLANADIAWSPGNPMLFSYDSVLCAWIALSLACGLYLLGVFRLPHDTPMESIGVVRMLLASIFFGLALYMVPALWRVTPQGIIGQGLVAFLPWDSRASELEWLRDYEEAYTQAVKEGKLIFIDFTGVNCTNCRANEKNVFVRPEVRRELEKYVRVQLYTDSVPDQKLSPDQASRQAARNSQWQSGTFNDVTNPFYAIIRPEKGQPAVLTSPDGTTKLSGADPHRTRKGYIKQEQIPDFQQFLSEPLRLAGTPRGADERTATVAAGNRPR